MSDAPDLRQYSGCGICNNEKVALVDGLCASCYKLNLEWQDQLIKLTDAGHTDHCAARQVWGDGECECRE